jgi:hypothetical protein
MARIGGLWLSVFLGGLITFLINGWINGKEAFFSANGGMIFFLFTIIGLIGLIRTFFD